MNSGTVRHIYRYPLKSGLGEAIGYARVTEAGLEGDRAYALVDRETGKVVSAKRPKLWRKMLLLSAQTGAVGGHIAVKFPDGRTEFSNTDSFVLALCEFLGRPVDLATSRNDGMQLDRLRPDEILVTGPDSDSTMDVHAIARETPGQGFQDLAPIHLVTTSTLRALAMADEPENLNGMCYRPNLVIDMDGTATFAENDWTGRPVTIGSVELRIMSPTPRCAVPTLAHGTDGKFRPEILRAINRLNRIAFEGTEALPCVGAYAQVVTAGEIRPGDAVTLG